jgi:hypothetical protein
VKSGSAKAPKLRTTMWFDDDGDSHEQEIGTKGLVDVLFERKLIRKSATGKALALDSDTALNQDQLRAILDEQKDFAKEKSLVERHFEAKSCKS